MLKCLLHGASLEDWPLEVGFSVNHIFVVGTSLCVKIYFRVKHQLFLCPCVIDGSPCGCHIYQLVTCIVTLRAYCIHHMHLPIAQMVHPLSSVLAWDKVDILLDGVVVKNVALGAKRSSSSRLAVVISMGRKPRKKHKIVSFNISHRAVYNIECTEYWYFQEVFHTV